MSLNNLNQIKVLRSDANKLRTIEEKFKERTSSSNIDKYRLEFSAQDRSLNAFSFNFSLVSYTGAYGSSSVSSFMSVESNQAVATAFYEWANKNRELILNGIADELDAKSNQLFGEAQREVGELQNFLNSLTI